MIYSSDEGEPDYLGEDMLDVVLENGMMVHAGWYPESDPNGRYVVQVANGLEIMERSETPSADEACRIVEAAVAANNVHKGS